MQLHDRLQICLLSVASRYPDAFVEINQEIPGIQHLETACWKVLDLIDLLQSISPDMLQVMAHLQIDEQKSEIHLTEHPQSQPAFIVYCRGKFTAFHHAGSKELQATAGKQQGSHVPFQHVLVPLDGSARAAQALPVAARIARIFGGSLIIMQSIMPSLTVARYTVGTLEKARASATHYLDMVMQQHKDLAGITATSEVFIGPPEEMIFAATSLYQCDLIVMSSKGETGLKRWALGSVAQKVSRFSPVPVFVLRDNDHLLQHVSANKPESICVMVALDGSPLAEATLAPAAYLSTALSAPAQGSLHLVRVLHIPSSLEYGQEDSVSQA
jgi:nucleotide-binding universal stress UspA family protein